MKLSLNKLTGWVKANPTQAIGGAAGVAGVTGYAIWHQRKNTTTAGGQTAAATGGATPVTDLSGYTAGLSGTPNTLGTDIENQVQDQINAFQSQMDAWSQQQQGDASGLSNLGDQVTSQIGSLTSTVGNLQQQLADAINQMGQQQDGGGSNSATAPATSSGPSAADVAHARAVYDNVLSHLKLAQAQYNKAPNATNAALVQAYQQHANQAQSAYGNLYNQQQAATPAPVAAPPVSK